jgi:predicted HTH transcriptional regulator
MVSRLINIIKNLQALPKECEWVEFKTNNSNPQEIGEYISALSNGAAYYNQSCGYLVFGIEDQTHILTGTNFKPTLEKIGNQELENWLATQLEPRIDFSIHEFEMEGKQLALFKIDATHNTPVKFKGSAFIRIGSYKKFLSDHPERERKIWQKSQQFVFEKEIALEGLMIDEVLSHIDYPAFFELQKLPLPGNKSSILEKLEQEKVIVKRGGKYDVTNLGAILFAKDINKFDKLSRKAIRVIFYKDKDRLNSEKEQPGVKGYAVGFEGLINFINDRLPSNEEIGRAFRKEVSVYPPLAIRELVANAIIHQDFSVMGTSPMVEIFKNRIEITNPGKPLIDPLRFIDHSPQSRNEKLASFMRRLKICEERGSGIDKVVSQCELFQLPAPDFIEGDNFTRTILYSPMTLRQMDKKDKIRACYQHCCLKYVSGTIMTNETLRSRFDIEAENYPMASRIISDTIDAGLIKDYDPESRSRKYAKYLPFWA